MSKNLRSACAIVPKAKQPCVHVTTSPIRLVRAILIVGQAVVLLLIASLDACCAHCSLCGANLGAVGFRSQIDDCTDREGVSGDPNQASGPIPNFLLSAYY